MWWRVAGAWALVALLSGCVAPVQPDAGSPPSDPFVERLPLAIRETREAPAQDVPPSTPCATAAVGCVAHPFRLPRHAIIDAFATWTNPSNVLRLDIVQDDVPMQTRVSWENQAKVALRASLPPGEYVLLVDASEMVGDRYTLQADFLEAAPPMPRPSGVSILPTVFQAFEPSIGITGDGSIFVVAGTQVIRSQDAGASWRVVQDHARQGSGQPETFDPWLWVDPLTDRVFVDHLWPILTCTLLYWSDDVGRSWTEGTAACPSPVIDFQKLVTGPPGPQPNPDVGPFPSVAYMCYNKPVSDIFVGAVGRYGTACATSYDGGASWKNEHLLSQAAYVGDEPLAEGCSGGSWGPAVGPDGTVVVRAQPDCMFRSVDSGDTWEMIGTGPPFQGTQFAYDAVGVLYALSAYWERPLRLARSLDDGETWDGPWLLQPPGVALTQFTAIAAGDDGRVVVAFLGTDQQAVDSSKVDDASRWVPWFVTTDDASAETPSFTPHRGSNADAPLHMGCIDRLIPCPFLGDFVTMALSPDGTPHVVFPDTCTFRCQYDPDARADIAGRVSATVVRLDAWSARQ